MADTALSLHNVSRRYGRTVHALRDITAEFARGSLTAVMGPSGSGKSTLLQCAAGLDKPTSGAVLLGDTDLTQLRESKLTALRRTRMGFVFQAFNLMPALTARQNVLLPLKLAGARADRAAADAMLDRVGLGGRGRARPGQLSGGQQQRVAIARALITQPDVIFADEPTAALDAGTAHEVLTLLRRAVDDLHATVVLVTHDPKAAAWSDRVLFLSDGQVAGELAYPSVEDIERTAMVPS